MGWPVSGCMGHSYGFAGPGIIADMAAGDHSSINRTNLNQQAGGGLCQLLYRN